MRLAAVAFGETANISEQDVGKVDTKFVFNVLGHSAFCAAE